MNKILCIFAIIIALLATSCQTGKNAIVPFDASKYIEAIKKNDIQYILKQLKSNKYPCVHKTLDADGTNALMLASAYGQINIVKLLIHNGADVNIQNSFDYSSLMYACKYSNYDIVKILVANGGDVNMKARGGYTALLITSTAAEKNIIPITKFLIKNGADVNVQIDNGDSLITNFMTEPEYMRYIITEGVDVNLKDKDEMTALMCTVNCGAIEPLKILLGFEAEVNHVDLYGRTAMDIINTALRNHEKNDKENIKKSNIIRTLLKKYGALTSKELKQSKNSEYPKPIKPEGSLFP